MNISFNLFFFSPRNKIVTLLIFYFHDTALHNATRKWQWILRHVSEGAD